MLSPPSAVYLGIGVLHVAQSLWYKSSDDGIWDRVVCAVVWAIILEILSRHGQVVIGWMMVSPALIVILYMTLHRLFRYLH